MVKRREPQASIATIAKREITEEQVEAFAAAADGGSVSKKNGASSIEKEKAFKSIRVSLSEHDYVQLHEAAKKSGRSKLSFIRRAIFEKAQAILLRNEKDI